MMPTLSIAGAAGASVAAGAAAAAGSSAAAGAGAAVAQAVKPTTNTTARSRAISFFIVSVSFRYDFLEMISCALVRSGAFCLYHAQNWKPRAPEQAHKNVNQLNQITHRRGVTGIYRFTFGVIFQTFDQKNLKDKQRYFFLYAQEKSGPRRREARSFVYYCLNIRVRRSSFA
jgi:hypothetical protein